MFTIGQLKKLIHNFDDDTPVKFKVKTIYGMMISDYECDVDVRIDNGAKIEITDKNVEK